MWYVTSLFTGQSHESWGLEGSIEGRRTRKKGMAAQLSQNYYYLPLLLFLLQLCSGNQTLLPIYPCNSSPGSPGTTHGTVRPTWIDPTLSQVGLLQTPNFPRPFALPLECLWIFDLTGLSRQAKTNYLHFYFTQVIFTTLNVKTKFSDLL